MDFFFFLHFLYYQISLKATNLSRNTFFLLEVMSQVVSDGL